MANHRTLISKRKFLRIVPQIFSKKWSSESIGDWPLSIFPSTHFAEHLTSHFQKSVLPVSSPLLRPTDSTRFIWLEHSKLLMNIQNKLVFVWSSLLQFCSPCEFFGSRFPTSCTRLRGTPSNRLCGDFAWTLRSSRYAFNPVLSREANKVFGPTWNQITPNLLGNSSRAYHRSGLVIRT